MSDAFTIRAEDMELLQCIALDWITDRQSASTPQQEAVMRTIARHNACAVADCTALVMLFCAALRRQQTDAGA